MKDWSQATGLGLQMLQAGDARGWLHIFDAEALLSALEHVTPEARWLTARPVLSLAMEADPLLERAVQTEIDFWVKLDRLRLRTYRDASKLYVSTLRAGKAENSLKAEHDRRVGVAEQFLPQDPVGDVTIAALVRQAKAETGLGLAPEMLSYLPRVEENFDYAGVET